jgi:uncharacterized membrane protein YhaH (DUF805 family)
VTPFWLTQAGIVPGVPRRPFPRARMRARRAWYWAGTVRWWSVLALLAGITCVVLAFLPAHSLAQIVGVAALSITLAILATREES